MDEYEFEIDEDYVDGIDYDCTNGFQLCFVSHKIRTAKKNYRCENCGKEIAANTRYMDFATKYARTRFCIECGNAVTGENN